MSNKTLGDEIREENAHYQWQIENGKLYDSMKSRAEAAEARADELVAQLKATQAEIATLQERIAELSSDMSDLTHVSAFERTAPIDWRSEYNDETPYGQALDGIGDEVEG